MLVSRIQNPECWFPEFRTLNAGVQIQNPECRFQNSERCMLVFRIQNAICRVPEFRTLNDGFNNLEP